MERNRVVGNGYSNKVCFGWLRSSTILILILNGVSWFKEFNKTDTHSQRSITGWFEEFNNINTHFQRSIWWYNIDWLSFLIFQHFMSYFHGRCHSTFGSKIPKNRSICIRIAIGNLLLRFCSLLRLLLWKWPWTLRAITSFYQSPESMIACIRILCHLSTA